MKIKLDTTLAKKAKASLIQKGKTLDLVETDSPLTSIDKLLKKNGLKLEDIEEFDFNPGPGSFTGIRVGSAVTQTLNWALGRKIKPKKLKYE